MWEAAVSEKFRSVRLAYVYEESEYFIPHFCPVPFCLDF